jgi:crooked neck
MPPNLQHVLPLLCCCCYRRRQPPSGEGSSAAEREARAIRARGVYERGFRAVREGAPDAKEEAVMLLEAWRDFEAQCSDFR